MRAPTLHRWLVVATACAALGGTCADAPERGFHAWIAALASSLSSPAPLSYAASDSRRADYDDMDVLLHALLTNDDALVIMTSDGSYGVFQYLKPEVVVPTPLEPGKVTAQFETLLSTYRRVWLVLVDWRNRWQAQPPAQYVGLLKQHYMRLPLPLPTYFADRRLAVGSTNYWQMQATILEVVLTAVPHNRNPQLFLSLAQVYRTFGKTYGAIAAYQRGIALFPENPYLHRELGACYYYECVPPQHEESIAENRLANQYHTALYDRPMYDALFNIAMAYAALGKREEAQLQYTTILATLRKYPDATWQSRTLRYLANINLELGNTNDAILRLKLDLQMNAQTPAYGYNRLLEIHEKNKAWDEFGSVARQYFYQCGTNDVQAIYRYTQYLYMLRKHSELNEAIIRANVWLREYPHLLSEYRARPAWWAAWTNITTSSGVSPAP